MLRLHVGVLNDNTKLKVLCLEWLMEYLFLDKVSTFLRNFKCNDDIIVILSR